MSKDLFFLLLIFILNGSFFYLYFMDPPTEYLDDILKKLLAVNLEVGAVAIASKEGLPIASALPRGADETRIATMTSTLFSLGRRAVIDCFKNLKEKLFHEKKRELKIVNYLNS